jgi:Protein of unknown function (DUF3017)
MANRPANAGAHSAGPQREPAAAPSVHRDAPPSVHRDAPPSVHQDAPPSVHHQGFPRSRAAPARRKPAPARRKPAPARRKPAPAGVAGGAAQALAWLPYLIVLAGMAAGLFSAWRGSQHAGSGAGVVGGALLVAAVARLILPPPYAGLLASRGKAVDVAAFAVLGAAVLGVALSLP